MSDFLSIYFVVAQCYLRLEDFDKCLRACRDALVIEPTNLKALYRASISLRSLNQLEQAEKYLTKASAIDPHNREILIEMSKLKDALDSALQAMNKKNDKSTNDVLSSLAVSEEFQLKFETLLKFHHTSDPLIIQCGNFSETEVYYIQLYVKEKQWTMDRINAETISIHK